MYQSQVPSKGWKIENLAVFTKEGITAFLKNVNKNVITTKYYTRTGARPLEFGRNVTY